MKHDTLIKRVNFIDINYYILFTSTALKGHFNSYLSMYGILSVLDELVVLLAKHGSVLFSCDHISCQLSLTMTKNTIYTVSMALDGRWCHFAINPSFVHFIQINQ